MENTMTLYGNKVYGVEVSNYGLENGYLDYLTLSKIVGNAILNNSIRTAGYPEDWELVCGKEAYDLDEEGCECDLDDDNCVQTIYYDIYQDYIISESGYKILSEYTDEIVHYNSELDIYLWGITHFGTSWDYVLTNIKLVTA